MPTLDWLTRDTDIVAAATVPYRLLDEVPELSCTGADPATENMLIQGDNLEALKSLLPFYAGKVKCVFIDPPYNTRSAFEHYDDNLEHSQWLSMMYPRLELLRELLSEDGSIWVTIDDNEAHYLKVVMDEVFGRSNFVVDVAWHKRISPGNDAKYFSNDHDHMFVVTKRKESWKPRRLEKGASQLGNYKNPDNDPRGPWNSAAYTCAKTADERPNLYYAITNPNNGQDVLPSRTRVWAFGKETHQENEKAGLLYWGADGKARMPRIKRFVDDTRPMVPRSIWPHSEAGHNQESRIEIDALFPGHPFTTPKPERLLRQMFRVATNSCDLVLDSFLGSGTTAAVAHKMGRRYIGIEMGDHAVTHCATRLRKVIEGEQGGISEAVGWQGGGGFRFYRLGQQVFDEEGRIREGIGFLELAAHVWFSETRTPRPHADRSPLLGVHEGTAYYLLYNGILRDRRPEGGNVLTRAVLADLPASGLPEGAPRVIYGESSRLRPATLKALGITFKQTPYDVRAR